MMNFRNFSTCYFDKYENKFSFRGQNYTRWRGGGSRERERRG